VYWKYFFGTILNILKCHYNILKGKNNFLLQYLRSIYLFIKILCAYKPYPSCHFNIYPGFGSNLIPYNDNFFRHWPRNVCLYKSSACNKPNTWMISASRSWLGFIFNQSWPLFKKASMLHIHKCFLKRSRNSSVRKLWKWSQIKSYYS